MPVPQITTSVSSPSGRFFGVDDDDDDDGAKGLGTAVHPLRSMRRGLGVAEVVEWRWGVVAALLLLLLMLVDMPASADGDDGRKPEAMERAERTSSSASTRGCRDCRCRPTILVYQACRSIGNVPGACVWMRVGQVSHFHSPGCVETRVGEDTLSLHS